MINVFFALAFIAVAAAIFRTASVFSALSEHLTREVEAARKVHEAWCGLGIGDREERLRHLEDMVEMLPQRWEQIRKEAERLDGRARHAVRRVEEELAERGLVDDTIQALAGELRLVDGDGGEESGVPPVREDLEEPPHAPTGTWRSNVLSQFGVG